MALSRFLRKGGAPWLTGDYREFLLSGLLGGYTTFSAFSLQTLALARDGHGGAALGNVVLSVTTCLVAVWAGFWLARTLSAT